MPQRMLRRRDVEARTCLSKSTLYRLMSEGRFPRPVPLGVRARAWPEEEIDAWLEERRSERDALAGEPLPPTYGGPAGPCKP